jgi:hypothetical protein
MVDAGGKRGRCKALHHCFAIQEERVRRLLSVERAQGKPLPNGWKEISLLIELADKIDDLEPDAQRASSQAPARTVTGGDPHSSIGAPEKIKNLDHLDRVLLREAAEGLLKIRGQLLGEVGDEKRMEPDAGEGSGGQNEHDK